MTFNSTGWRAACTAWSACRAAGAAAPTRGARGPPAASKPRIDCNEAETRVARQDRTAQPLGDPAAAAPVRVARPGTQRPEYLGLGPPGLRQDHASGELARSGGALLPLVSAGRRRRPRRHLLLLPERRRSRPRSG